jgi:hypothetical protein
MLQLSERLEGESLQELGLAENLTILATMELPAVA